MITRSIAVYDLQELVLKPVCDAAFVQEPFYLTFPVPMIPEAETVLMQIPGALELRLICRSYEDEHLPGGLTAFVMGRMREIDTLRGECVFQFNEQNEWILEAAFTMQNDLTQRTETFFLRMPLSHPAMETGEIGLYFDGTWLRFLKDGEVLNENKGEDRFMPEGHVWIYPTFSEARWAAAKHVEVTYRNVQEDCCSDFYLPHGWNAFAGDVMNGYYNGIYHMLYLLDRRHHRSWNGKGGHYIAHVTSEDLINWTEHEPAVEIRYPWQTFGTGTMVFHGGKYYMSHGLHTERYVWNEDDQFDNLAHRTQRCQVDANGIICTETPFCNWRETQKIPHGATYSVSEDGIHFEPSEKLYHTARNPSIYVNEAGGLTLWAGLADELEGLWEMDGFGEPLVRVGKNTITPETALVPFTTECPSLFRWNGYQYLIMGFSGYFRTKEPGSDHMMDAIAAGECIYDGLQVPMVSDYKDGRKLIAGWIESIGWGSAIVHRELVQETGGKLGMKWVPEMVPRTKPGNLAAEIDLNHAAVELDANKSYLIQLTVRPNACKRLGIVFENDRGKACELQLDFESKRMQINDAPQDRLADPLKTLAEQAAHLSMEAFSALQNVPQKSVNFCLSNMEGLEDLFAMRILCRHSKRMDSTVLDVELAGRQTLISGRKRFFCKKLFVRQDGDAKIETVSVEELQSLVL